MHWILTEDPVAGLLVQRQATYALASYYEYRRKRGDVAYRAYDEQTRGIYNLLSALWKARDVSQHVAARRGTVIWRPARTERMAVDIIADIDRQKRQPIVTAKPDDERYLHRIVGLPLGGVGTHIWKTVDGGQLKLRGASAFQTVQYGKEPLHLWTRAGNPRVRRWFQSVTRHHVVRVLHIGSLGIDRAENVRGSTYPLAPVGALPFTNDVGWARWVKTLPIAPRPTDRYDGAAIHTLTQTKELLLLAKSAGLKVPELDAALARINADWSRMSEPRYTRLDWPKHWAAAR